MTGGRIPRADSETLGERLRAVRRRKHLTLLEVQALSHNEFKASALGAYERGERVISTTRLMRLAEVYGTAPSELVPGATTAREIDLTATESSYRRGCRILVAELAAAGDTVAQAVSRFVGVIRSHRQESATMATIVIRDEDLTALGAAVGLDAPALRAHLDRLGMTAPAVAALSTQR